MAVPQVDQKLLGELESFGFPLARATRALHYSGNSTIEAAVEWILDHEDDLDIDEMPLVPVEINIESSEPSYTEEEMKIKTQELRDRALKKREEKEKILEREKEKERIRVGKELLQAKQIKEENERKSMIALREAEKKEEKRARERILQKLEQDKAERRRRLGLQLDNPAVVKLPSHVLLEKKNSLPLKSTTNLEQIRGCLRSLKRNYKGNDARVKRAFQTLLIYVGNVAKNPNEEKFRKIRFSNPSFQARVGSLKGGVEFLELCGFERIEGGKFLFLPRDKVDMALLNSAGSVLKSALTNPFFGVFSKG